MSTYLKTLLDEGGFTKGRRVLPNNNNLYIHIKLTKIYITLRLLVVFSLYLDSFCGPFSFRFLIWIILSLNMMTRIVPNKCLNAYS